MLAAAGADEEDTELVGGIHSCRLEAEDDDDEEE